MRQRWVEFPGGWRYNREVKQVGFMHFPEVSSEEEQGEDGEDGGGMSWFLWSWLMKVQQKRE